MLDKLTVILTINDVAWEVLQFRLGSRRFAPREHVTHDIKIDGSS